MFNSCVIVKVHYLCLNQLGVESGVRAPGYFVGLNLKVIVDPVIISEPGASP